MNQENVKGAQMHNPAHDLLGLSLEGGWKVVEPIERYQGQTGGAFSVGYVVVNEQGKRAYLKAMDYSRAFQSADPARALEPLVNAFNFERDLLMECRHMSRVVTALTDGVIRLDGLPVQYLILELADSDARRQMFLQQFDDAWSLRALHQVAVGLDQLHKKMIAHQDLKPSNVLIFEQKQSKVGDLGRSIKDGRLSPHEGLNFPGALAYSPPEYLYRNRPEDWMVRRFGSDIYLLGSLLHFFYTGVALTPALGNQLDPNHKWDKWNGTFAEILPFLYAAFTNVREEFLKNCHSEDCEELDRLLSYLCDPDPYKRGHPGNKAINVPYGLDRFVSRFDFLATRAEMRLSIAAKKK